MLALWGRDQQAHKLNTISWFYPLCTKSFSEEGRIKQHREKSTKGPLVPPSCYTGMKRSQIKLHWSLLHREEPPVEQCILPDTQGSCSHMQKTLEFLLKTNCLCKKPSGLRTPAHPVLLPSSMHVCGTSYLKLHCTATLLPTFPLLEDSSGGKLINLPSWSRRPTQPHKKEKLWFPGRRLSW